MQLAAFRAAGTTTTTTTTAPTTTTTAPTTTTTAPTTTTTAPTTTTTTDHDDHDDHDHDDDDAHHDHDGTDDHHHDDDDPAAPAGAGGHGCQPGVRTDHRRDRRDDHRLGLHGRDGGELRCDPASLLGQRPPVDHGDRTGGDGDGRCDRHARGTSATGAADQFTYVAPPPTVVPR